MKVERLCAALSVALLLIVSSTVAASFDPAPEWEHRTHSNGQFYDLYVPSDIPPGTKCPIVLALHGCCGDGIDYGEVRVGGDPIYRAWHHNTFNTQDVPTFIIAPGISSNWFGHHTQLMQILDDLIAEFPIDTQRIIVTGFSMGGRGTIDFINANPTKYSAALPIAAAVSSPANGPRLKNIPIWGGDGADDSWLDEHMMTVTPIREANGDTRGPVTYLTGINPRFDIYPNTGHGPSMEGLYTQPDVVPWALSRLNDGNNYPMIKFTQATPDHGQTLDAAVTSISVTAEAFDDGGAVTQVEFFIDGTPVSTDTEAPYEATVSGLVPGDHVLTATVTDNGSSQGYTMDKTQTATLKFAIQSTPTIANPAIPAGANGAFYRHRFVTNGGNAPFTWTATGTLPTGVEMWENGSLEGVPFETGEFPLTITVLDKEGDAATAEVTLSVGPPPAGVAGITNYSENARAVFYAGLFAVGEPYALTGYGYPAGTFHQGNFNPVYDIVTDAGDLEGSLLFRASTVAADITSTAPDMITFDVSADVTVHVLYPRHDNNNFPSWLSSEGYTQTGDTLRVERCDYIDFEKSFSGGSTVVVPGNDGSSVDVNRHYLLVVESANPIVSTLPRTQAAPVSAPRIAVTGRTVRLSLPAGQQCRVTVLDTRGRVVSNRTIKGGDASVRMTQAAGVYMLRAQWIGGETTRSISIR